MSTVFKFELIGYHTNLKLLGNCKVNLIVEALKTFNDEYFITVGNTL